MIHPLIGMTVAILVAHGFEEAEMIGPKRALEDAGARVVIVSPERTPVRGWKSDRNEWGSTYLVEVALENAVPDQFDALLIPGGLMSPDDLRSNERALAFVKAFAHKPIGAICHGPWVLIDAGLVAGKRITSWPSIEADIKNAGGVWIDAEVIQDGGLVTSRMPEDIPAFSQAFIRIISYYKEAKQAAVA